MAKNSLERFERPVVLTVEEVAASLKISKQTAYKLVESRELPSYRIGSQIRIPVEAFDRYLALKLAVAV
jgi:excisionase family DNA binding protein